MPAQKRPLDTQDEDPPLPPPLQLSDNTNHREEEESAEHDGDVEVGRSDSDNRSSFSSSCDEKPEFLTVALSEVCKEVQCPICLGIIRKTRTVMECLHRFCRGCIEKSMRMGNNECPACRTHCASRRSLRDDPNFDAIISLLYPDIDKYEKEELAFHEEEKARNKQIQASIAQTFIRQTEALAKKKMTAKATAAFLKRSQGRRNQATELQLSDDDDEEDEEEQENGNSGGKDFSSSADGLHTGSSVLQSITDADIYLNGMILPRDERILEEIEPMERLAECSRGLLRNLCTLASCIPHFKRLYQQVEDMKKGLQDKEAELQIKEAQIADLQARLATSEGLSTELEKAKRSIEDKERHARHNLSESLRYSNESLRYSNELEQLNLRYKTDLEASESFNRGLNQEIAGLRDRIALIPADVQAAAEAAASDMLNKCYMKYTAEVNARAKDAYRQGIRDFKTAHGIPWSEFDDEEEEEQEAGLGNG